VVPAASVVLGTEAMIAGTKVKMLETLLSA
jgi:hypothetical protein